ncbi:MAG: endonuclease NucS [Candidatus Altiarchaeota archaeon]|nr:endonuclease NucS [Candidatus Altiarchaeota archaeon]
MDSYEASERLSRDLSEHRVVVLVCSCSIEYWGRGRSVVGSGDRVILFKPDTTIIVHSLSGFKPLNWMSPPTDTSVDAEGNDVMVFSQKTTKPFEEIKIRIHEVKAYNSYAGLKDKEKLDLTHNEKDMRDYLAKNTHIIHPEFRLKSLEYRSPLGFFDLYGRIGSKYVVVELKSEKAGLPAALQIKRYSDWLRSHIKEEVLGILMAPSITPNALNLLRKEGVEYIKFDIKDIKETRKRNPEGTLGRWIIH